MPLSESYRQRLYPQLEKLTEHFGTPFHIYDEIGIRNTIRRLNAILGDFSFQEYYAVKALPNPHVLAILREEGCGFDCSSVAEIVLVRQVGARGDEIMFTSNNTSAEEFAFAMADGGCILNLDDISLIDKLPHVPDLISFRLNPGRDMG